MAEQVNHPAHYNSHPNGIECIDIIRHYTCDIANAIKYLWRAGLKPKWDKAAIEREKSDAGIGYSERELARLKVKDDAEKEIEDLKKAIFYIEDYQRNGVLAKMARLLAVG